MIGYVEHVAKYDFSPLCFPVSYIGSFAVKNYLSINVYGVDNDNKVIYPLRVSRTIVPNRHVDLLLYEYGGIQHYATISNFSRLVCIQFSNRKGATHFCCVSMATQLQECGKIMVYIATTHRGLSFHKNLDVDLPTYRSSYQYLL